MAHDTPQWLTSAVIYEVFVRNHGPRGGYASVTADLDRIRSLGVDVLWLMPIYPIGLAHRNGTVGSPYAIQDFRGLNPELGTEDELRALIAGAHDRGIKIILDIVFNHTSPDSVLAQAHPEWFLHDAEGRPAPKFPEWADIVDLRYLDPEGRPRTELWDIQVETLGRWVDLGFDGFRCDVASVVPPAFWARAKADLARRAPGRPLLWLAETVHKHFLKFMRDRGYGAWSDGEVLQVFDLSYDHDGAEYLDEYFAGRGSLERYLDHLFVQETMLPARSLKLRFTENHDLPRTAAKVRGAERLRSWTAFQALLPGAFLVYAGQEWAAEERPDLFVKAPIRVPADAGRHPHEVWLRRLVGAMKAVKGACPSFSAAEAATGVVVLRWEGDEEAYTAVLNLEDRFGTFDPGRIVKGTNLLDGTEVDLGPGSRIPKEPVLVKDGAFSPPRP